MLDAWRNIVPGDRRAAAVVAHAGQDGREVGVRRGDAREVFRRLAVPTQAEVEGQRALADRVAEVQVRRIVRSSDTTRSR